MSNSSRRGFTTASGFTLVEMLVVITIIGILAALLLPAVNRAIISARNASIAIEVNQLASAIESYKQDKGDYPPNFRDQTVVIRHIRKCYPKADPTYISSFVTKACTQSATPPNYFIDEGEALVFWLSMTDTDPRYPFLSYYNPTPATLSESPKKYYDFDENRLAPIRTTEVEMVGAGAYAPDLRQQITRDVRAHLDKAAKDAFYIYADSRSYASLLGTPSAYAEGGEATRPYWTKTVANSSATLDQDKTKPVNPTTFQILCAGLDGEFGAQGTVLKYFPDGSNYTDEDNDNITNFSSGKTLKDNIPN